MKKFTKILGVMALTGWMGVANATLIFDFSWDSSNGKISGEILGLTNVVGSQSATGIVITSIDEVDVSIDVVNSPGWGVYSNVNEFVVSNGEIDFFHFTAHGPGGSELYLDSHSSGLYFQGTLHFGYEGCQCYFDADVNDTSVSVVNRVTVPEPNSVLLLSLGLAGLSFARYRKQY
jgi:hypothetical protein